jgi:hypothetical protein
MTDIWIRPPLLGADVHYRGRLGLNAPRAAKVIATIQSLDPAGVESGQVPPIDSDRHAHLLVFTPNPDQPFFVEFNVPHGDGPGEWHWA